MFEAGGPRVFALPVGADFPAELVAGLRQRMTGRAPETMAQIRLFLNTTRMNRRVSQLFAQSGAMILPRMGLITSISGMPGLGLPPAVSPLRRRLELAKLIAALLESDPDLAPRAALYDLADRLARLVDELQSEGLHPDVLAGLDVSNHAAHWARTQSFLSIIAPLFGDTEEPDLEALQRMAVERLIAKWQNSPPEYPVIVAGSTGSRGTTLKLMAAVARLPQGALILPGYDFDLPPAVWAQMDDALTAEDHPQFRYRRLMDHLDITPERIMRWTDTPAPAPRRNQLVSLALRPAPVTDQWLIEGPDLSDLQEATDGISLIEAPTQRIEALAIALVLREAAEQNRTAALISPDRNLTRQVTAALDRWGILPDDSAGRPLALSPPGRFLRQIVGLFGEKLTAEKLLAVLKHPLTSSSGDRGSHLRYTRDLELSLRRYGPAFPTGADLRNWALTRPDSEVRPWAEFVALALDGLEGIGTRALVDQVNHHRILAELMARGTSAEGSGGLWEKAAGIAALAQIEALQSEAPHGGAFTASEYRDLFSAHLAKVEIREPVQSHPLIMIWGTLEARVQGADLVILGGLNDGIWPALPDPDPWLNRRMRKDAGLLLPERQIGLSAHDFQQAIGAPQVVLSRALRDADAETVSSRWLNRLLNLMQGLPGQNGPAAQEAMKSRGSVWVARALALDRPGEEMAGDPRLKPAQRPAPQPPISARPNRLSLTRISQLIRDPYAIYARHILRLKPLDPLRAEPDPRERGTIFHDILERFVKDRPIDESRVAARQRLLQIANDVVSRETPFPAARILWLARMERAANHFLTEDSRHGGTSLMVEAEGSLPVEQTGFTLFGTPDRIDRLPDGRLHLIDYKTGTPPTRKQQENFDKQLRLAAIMAERGGFPGIDPDEVARITYIGLGAAEKVENSERQDLPLDREWERFVTLITRYAQRSTGYTARRAVFEDRIAGDYDHLARYGEWQMSDHAQPELVGEPAP